MRNMSLPLQSERYNFSVLGIALPQIGTRYEGSEKQSKSTNRQLAPRVHMHPGGRGSGVHHERQQCGNETQQRGNRYSRHSRKDNTLLNAFSFTLFRRTQEDCFQLDKARRNVKEASARRGMGGRIENNSWLALYVRDVCTKNCAGRLRKNQPCTSAQTNPTSDLTLTPTI